MAHGADLNAVDHKGNSVLHLRPTYARYWVDKGLNVNVVNNRKQTVLHTMLDAGDTSLLFDQYLPVVDVLCRSGFNINAKDELGDTPLHVAYRHVPSALVSMLSMLGGGPQAERAIQSVSMLKKYGANVNVKNNDGKKPAQVMSDVYEIEREYPSEDSDEDRRLFVENSCDEDEYDDGDDEGDDDDDNDNASS